MASCFLRIARSSLNTQNATLSQRAMFSTSINPQWRATSILGNAVAETRSSGSAFAKGIIPKALRTTMQRAAALRAKRCEFCNN